MPDRLPITYRFVFDDGMERDFSFELDARTLSLIQPEGRQHPEWARLDFFKCPNCPLDPAKHRECPAAANLFRPIVAFKDFVSYDQANVYVETPSRQYFRRTPLHVGLGSMVGLIMATCGCPILGRLKPMARFHLPFADENETTYRVLSMYLMAQFLKEKEGDDGDWTLDGLAKMYHEVMTVNKHFVTRLQNIPIKDASLNAVITLDCFAMTVSFAVEQDMLEDIQDLFRDYLSNPEG